MERRRHVRQAVSGEAEITSVTGSTDVPPGIGRVVDCSRGGALLRLPNTRRHLFAKNEPCLRPRDSVTCTLRMPPTFQEVEVLAEVVRVTWAREGDDAVNVGLRFFYDAARRSHTDKSMQSLFQALGPDCWSSASRPALPSLPAASPAASTSARLKKVSGSGRVQKGTSARLPKNGSARLKKLPRDESVLEKKATSGRVKKTSSGSHKVSTSGRVKATSGRINKPASDTHSVTTSGRIKRPSGDTHSTSGRIKRPLGDTHSVTTSGRVKKVTLKYHSSSGRIPVAAMAAPPPSYHRLAGPEFGLYLRGRATLVDGRSVIELPAHFVEATIPETLTVHLTPTAQCCGLYLRKRSATHLVIGELMEGRSDATFDYMVVAQRRLGD